MSIARRRRRQRREGDSGRAVVLALVAALAVTAGVTSVLLLRPRPAPAPAAPALRLSLVPRPDLALGGGVDYPFGLALAPDGRRLAFPATETGPHQLWLHDLTTGEAQVLPGTDEAVQPFWSPDGRMIAFFAAGKLRVLALDQGQVQEIADAAAPHGGVWHPNGDIVFAAAADGGLLRRAADGTIQALTTVETAGGETGHRHPALVNDGRDLLFFVRANEPTREGVWLAPLDDPGRRQRLVRAEAHAVASGDLVLYASGDALVAQRFDAGTRALAGQPDLVGTPVGRGPQNQLFATAAADLVVYGAPASGLRELRWIDRAGGDGGRVGEPMIGWDVRASPAGDRVAVARVDPQLSTLDIWIYDGTRPLPQRISRAIDADESPVWSRDGTRLAWVTGRRTVTVRGALAALPEQPLHTFERPVRVTDWSPDDRWIVVSGSSPESRSDLWLLSADGRGTLRPYAQSPFNETQGVVSPDGRWIAYASDESGRFEIYVDAFPAPAARARLTMAGGTDPRWHARGGELYFRRGDEIHAVTLAPAGSRLEAAATERLVAVGGDLRAYDAAPDGRRFLVNVPASDRRPLSLTVLVHPRRLLGWPAP